MSLAASEKKARIAELERTMEPKYLSVCGHILAGKTNAEAWMAVYKRVKKKHTGESACGRMLSNVESGAREYIKLNRWAATANAAEDLGIDEKRILAELSALAFGNIQDMYDGEGNLIPICDLPREVAASIQSTKAKREQSRNPKDGEDDTETHILEVKVYDKSRSLVDLGKHIGMFKEKIDVEVNQGLAALLESFPPPPDA